MSGNNGTGGNAYPYHQHHRNIRTNNQRGQRSTSFQQPMYPHPQLPVAGPPQFYNQVVQRGQQPSQLYTSAQHNMHYTQTPLAPAPLYYYPPVVMHTTHDPASLPNPYLRGQGMMGPDAMQQQMSMPPPNMIVANQAQGPAVPVGATNRLAAPKKRTHALQIIDPVTGGNILDEIKNTKSEAAASGSSKPDMSKSAPQALGNNNICNLQRTAVNPINKAELQGAAFVNKMQQYNISVVPDILPGDYMEHTPIVSALADGPSVEIHIVPPITIIEQKSKSIEIVAPSTDIVNSCLSTTSDLANSEINNLTNLIQNSDEAVEQIEIEQIDDLTSGSLNFFASASLDDNPSIEEQSEILKHDLTNIDNIHTNIHQSEPVTITNEHKSQENRKDDTIIQKSAVSNETSSNINKQSEVVAVNEIENNKPQENILKDNIIKKSSDSNKTSNINNQSEAVPFANDKEIKSEENILKDKKIIQKSEGKIKAAGSKKSNNTTNNHHLEEVSAIDSKKKTEENVSMDNVSQKSADKTKASNNTNISNQAEVVNPNESENKSQDKIMKDQINQKSAGKTKASGSNKTSITNKSPTETVAANDNQNKTHENVPKDNTVQKSSGNTKTVKGRNKSNKKKDKSVKDNKKAPTEDDLPSDKPIKDIRNSTDKEAGIIVSSDSSKTVNTSDPRQVPTTMSMPENLQTSNTLDYEQGQSSNANPIEKHEENNQTGNTIQMVHNEDNDACQVDDDNTIPEKPIISDQSIQQQSCDETDKSVSHVPAAIDDINNCMDNDKIINDKEKTVNVSSFEKACSSNDNESVRIEKPKNPAKSSLELPTLSSSSSSKDKDLPKETCTDNKQEDDTPTEVSKENSVTPLITYEEGQWSPMTPLGNKSYSKNQLLTLRDAPGSKFKPEIKNKTAKTVLKSTITPQPSLMPSFIRNQGKRNQSWDASGGPNSSGRNQHSKHSSMYGNAKGSMTKVNEPEMIHVSLSLQGDVKLNETENAWRPTRLQKNDNKNAPDEVNTSEQLYRKVRGMLNKLTPDNFDSLVAQILSLQIDTPEKVKGVMILVFEKAIDEPNFSMSYARLCKRLGDIQIKATEVKTNTANTTNKSDVVQFKASILNKTQHEFNDNVLECKAKVEKLKPIIDKMKECTDDDQKAELKATLDDEERKIRRRSGGTVRFIGELFKIAMLTHGIINFCINKLLDQSNEDKLECMCKLLTTVGQPFEQTVSKEGVKFNLDAVIKKMQSIVDKKADSKISSRIRFMLQDVIDLRKSNWASKLTDLKPKTMEQIQKDTEREQINNHILNSAYSSNKHDDRRFNSGGGGGNSNNSMGGAGGRDFHNKNNNRQQSWNIGGDSGYSRQQKGQDNWCTPSSKSNRVVDANKLTSTPDYDFTKPVLGSSSQFQWNNRTKDNVKPTVTSSNSFSALLALDTNSLNSERGESRNSKGSFNKRSIELDKNDRYGGRHSRNDSGHRSRENSSSRNTSNWSRVPSSNIQSNQRSNRTQIPDPKSLSSSASAMSSSSIESSSKSVSKSNSSSMTKLNFTEIPDDGIETLKKTVIKMLSPESTIEDSIEIFEKCQRNYRWAIIYTILTDYLHLHQTKQSHRERCAESVILFYNKKLLTTEDIRYSYNQFLEIVEDILIDVPSAWKYVLEFTGPLLHKKIINLKDIWIEKPLSAGDDSGKKFLKQLFTYHCQEFGPHYTNELWRTSGFKWTTFMPKQSVEKFIQDNNFGYVESLDTPPTVAVQDMPRINNRIKYLLENNADTDTIMDYISGNIQNIDKEFIRGLTTTILKHSINPTTYKLDQVELRKVGINLLQRYMDSREQRELECLYAIQELVVKLEHPAGLLADICLQLYECYVIASDSFIKWRDSKHEPSGKGVAVKSLTSFFCIFSNNGSDESN